MPPTIFAVVPGSGAAVPLSSRLFAWSTGRGTSWASVSPTVATRAADEKTMIIVALIDEKAILLPPRQYRFRPCWSAETSIYSYCILASILLREAMSPKPATAA